MLDILLAVDGLPQHRVICDKDQICAAFDLAASCSIAWMLAASPDDEEAGAAQKCTPRWCIPRAKLCL